MDCRAWLDDTELRRCSSTARALLIDLMCLAAEGVPYGHVSDKSGAIPDVFLASRFCLPMSRLLAGVEDLKEHSRIAITEDGVIYVPRMVRDEEIRRKREGGGMASASHPNVRKAKALADAEVRKQLVTEVIVTSGLQGTLPGVGPEPVSDAPDGFEAWWALWSSVRGTHRMNQAVQAWISVVRFHHVRACMACTASYLDGLDNPVRGFDPQNFLYDQVKQNFEARWPPNRRNQKRDMGSEIADLARQRWEEDGTL